MITMFNYIAMQFLRTKRVFNIYKNVFTKLFPRIESESIKFYSLKNTIGNFELHRSITRLLIYEFSWKIFDTIDQDFYITSDTPVHLSMKNNNAICIHTISKNKVLIGFNCRLSEYCIEAILTKPLNMGIKKRAIRYIVSNKMPQYLIDKLSI